MSLTAASHVSLFRRDRCGQAVEGDIGAHLLAQDVIYVWAALSLFRFHGNDRTARDIGLEQDIVYIGGGSMRNLLAIWRAHALDEVLLEAWERGIVLAGLSAGAMCWFEGGVSRSGGPPQTIAGLGMLPGSLSVHADGEPERLPVFMEAIRRGDLPGGWAADDGVGLLFRGTELERAVSSRPGAAAMRVDAVEELRAVQRMRRRHG